MAIAGAENGRREMSVVGFVLMKGESDLLEMSKTFSVYRDGPTRLNGSLEYNYGDGRQQKARKPAGAADQISPVHKAQMYENGRESPVDGRSVLPYRPK
ncbi:MAG: hypothetical protein M3552_06410 [Planctomycetota bacterium]|nr:hypothetical protein [Planctomycetota bacterium]